jgi:hypothetical protein
MATISRADLVSYAGAPVLDPTGERIGTLHVTFDDDVTGEPAWIGISTDLPGQGLRVAPAEGAEAVGAHLHVARALEAVRASPPVQGAAISSATDRALRRYYGLAEPETSPDDESTDEWEASGEDPEIGTREDEGDRLTIRREVPDDPDAGRVGDPDVR